MWLPPRKIEAISSWIAPKTVRDTQRFLGFANFYRGFIRNFAELATPLNSLTQRTKPFRWTQKAQESFDPLDALKRAFTTSPILKHVDPARPFVLETDSSDLAIGAVLSQYHDNTLHPVAFFSRKLTAAEINYEIHDKELLAIVASFAQSRQYLLGAQHKTTVYSDHKNLKYFMTTRVLNRRQARWSLAIS